MDLRLRRRSDMWDDNVKVLRALDETGELWLVPYMADDSIGLPKERGKHRTYKTWGKNFADTRRKVGLWARIAHKAMHTTANRYAGRHRKSWWRLAIEAYAAIGVLGV